MQRRAQMHVRSMLPPRLGRMSAPAFPPVLALGATLDSPNCIYWPLGAAKSEPSERAPVVVYELGLRRVTKPHAETAAYRFHAAVTLQQV